MSELKQRITMKAIIKPTIFFLLIGYFVKYLWSSFDAIFLELRETCIWLALGVVFLGILYQLVEGKMVQTTIQVTGKPFRTVDGMLASCYAAFYRVITFGAGTWLAEINFYHRQNLTISEGVGVAVFRFMLFKTAACILAIFFLIAEWYLFPAKMIWLVIICIVINLLINGIILLAALSMPLQILFVILCDHWIKKAKWRAKVDQVNLQINALRQMTHDLMHKKRLLFEMILWGIVKALIWFIIPYMCLKADHPDVNLFISLALISFVTVISGVIPTPGGVGSFEISYMIFFTPYVGKVDAASSLLLYRFATFILPFIIGGAYTFISRKNNKN